MSKLGVKEDSPLKKIVKKVKGEKRLKRETTYFTNASFNILNRLEEKVGCWLVS